MRKILKTMVVALSILITSCSNDEPEKANIRINHYQDTGYGSFKQLIYLVQENEAIDTDKWSVFYDNIEGFNYEPGYIYDLTISKEKINNPPADGSAVHYKLEQLISKKPVENNVAFEILLQRNYGNTADSFLTGDLNSGYKILDNLEIDCSGLCQELKDKLDTKKNVYGLFNHLENGKLKVIDIKVK